MRSEAQASGSLAIFPPSLPFQTLGKAGPMACFLLGFKGKINTRVFSLYDYKALFWTPWETLELFILGDHKKAREELVSLLALSFTVKRVSRSDCWLAAMWCSISANSQCFQLWHVALGARPACLPRIFFKMLLCLAPNTVSPLFKECSTRIW